MMACTQNMPRFHIFFTCLNAHIQWNINAAVDLHAIIWYFIASFFVTTVHQNQIEIFFSYQPSEITNVNQTFESWKTKFKAQGGGGGGRDYSNITVTGRCEDLFWVWNLGSEDFLVLEVLILLFLCERFFFCSEFKVASNYFVIYW